MTTHGLILAAGSGQRFGSDKMMIKIDGRFPWEIVRERLASAVDDVTVVGIDIAGGVSRRMSIIAGLAHLSESTDRVIIAEGARFLATPDDYRTISRAEGDAVAFGSLLINSVYDMHIDRPTPRHNCWEVHTPQAFDVKFLRHVIASHHEGWVHDEWSLARMHYPRRCRLIHGDWRTRFKLTVPSDLDVMGALHAIP